jgi:cbb3-type cytochrome oxidase subunit 3
LNSEQKKHDDEMIVRYLLGELAQKERDEFEEVCFADDQYFEEVLASEADLTDEYVRGDLVGRRREQYEKHLLSKIEGKDNVEFARILTASQAATPVPDRRPFNSWLDFRSRVFQVSFATLALIFLAVALWLFWSSRRTRSHQEQAVQEPAPAGVKQQDSSQTPDHSAPAGSQSSATPELSKQSNNRKTPAPIESLSIVSLLVVPGFERSTGGANDLIISPQARRVRLQLAMEGAKYRNYLAVLQSVEGKDIFARNGLKARSTSSGSAVTLELPASSFPQGDFILTLSGATSQGKIEEVHKYFLSVSKK